MGRKENLEIAKFMPPLRHSNQKNLKFDINDCDAVKWLLDQPSIKQEIWNIVKGLKNIVYDPDTNKWTGVNYKDVDCDRFDDEC